jgi:hypothetical protein
MHGFEVQKENFFLFEINYSAFNRLVLGSSPRHPKAVLEIIRVYQQPLVGTKQQTYRQLDP